MMLRLFSPFGVRILEHAMCLEVLWLLMPPFTRGSEAQGLWTLALETDRRGLIHSSANGVDNISIYLKEISTLNKYQYLP